jgi:PAS domain-containing protein
MKDTVKQSQYDSQMKELSLTWVQTETSGERTFELAQELKELKTILNYIVNEIPDIIYRLDTNGSITFVNDAVRAYGYKCGFKNPYPQLC